MPGWKTSWYYLCQLLQTHEMGGKILTIAHTADFHLQWPWSLGDTLRRRMRQSSDDDATSLRDFAGLKSFPTLHLI